MTSGLVGDSLSAPPPGSTASGDLYVDLQTRTMWMGVDQVIDPAGAVLISDIMSIQPAINASLAIAQQYTDTKLTGYSVIGHKHVAADVTDFDAAVHAAMAGGGGSGGFFPGFVGMYSGPMANIGVGPLAGWALCDGSNGTPDMRDRFVLGAGNRATGVINTLTQATTDVIPAHKHVAVSHVLTQAEMPVHAHAVSGSGSGSGGTDGQGDHQHYFGASYIGDGGRGEGAGGNGLPNLIGNFGDWCGG